MKSWAIKVVCGVSIYVASLAVCDLVFGLTRTWMFYAGYIVGWLGFSFSTLIDDMRKP